MTMKESLLFLIGILFFSTGFSQTENFEFRDSFRPTYHNTLSIAQLAELQANSELIILDVRLPEDLAQNPSLIPGAQYMNPELLPDWIDELDKSKEMVVYCVAGKWVSQKVAHILNEAGVSVRSLEGGYEAWAAKKNDT